MKIEGKVKERNSDWQHTRLIAYNIYCSATEKNRLSIYDYLPLSTDPTEAQRKKMRAKSDKKEMKAREAEAMKMIEMQSKFFNTVKLEKQNAN